MKITLSKAIEILTLNVKEGHNTMPEDVQASCSLALNCMETVKYIRRGGEWSFTALFPGEAPEENPN